MALTKNNILFWISMFILASISALFISYNPINTLILAIFLITSGVIFALLLRMPHKTLNFLSSLLIISIFLVPSINVAGIGLRLDDYIVVFFTMALIFIYYKEEKIDFPPIMKWLVAYLMYSSFITVAYILFDDLRPLLLLFFIKEIQYFVYFFVFYYLAKNYEKFVPTIKNTFVVVSFVTIVWGAYQLATNSFVGDYGIGIVSISAPSQSGIVLFITSLFLLYMSCTTTGLKKSLLLYSMTILALTLTFATVSRTAISVTIATLVLYLFISIFKRWNMKKILISVYFSVLAIPISYILVNDLIYSMFERFSRFGQGAQGRAGFWQGFLSHSDTLGHIFGNGKGFMQEIVGTLTLKADSQYVRLILEVGLIGLFLWLILIFSIIIFSLKNLKASYYDALFLLLLTISFMIIGITQEGYLVTLQGSLYWMLTGLFMGNIIRQKKINNKESI